VLRVAQREAAKMSLKVPAEAFHAYLFDCDGTIADFHAIALHCMEKRVGRMEL
jgi:hypothetical protein